MKILIKNVAMSVVSDLADSSKLIRGVAVYSTPAAEVYKVAENTIFFEGSRGSWNQHWRHVGGEPVILQTSAPWRDVHENWDLDAIPWADVKFLSVRFDHPINGEPTNIATEVRFRHRDKVHIAREAVAAEIARTRDLTPEAWDGWTCNWVLDDPYYQDGPDGEDTEVFSDSGVHSEVWFCEPYPFFTFHGEKATLPHDGDDVDNRTYRMMDNHVRESLGLPPL